MSRWKIERSLGEGGQAHTFLVKRDGDARLYVMKRLKNLKRMERFKREVEALRRLDHPNILTIIDADLETSPPYFVTNYCEGGTLEQWRDSRPSISLDRVFCLLGQIVDALQTAHGSQILHRDLKPANVFMDASHRTAIVGDFGLCLLVSEERITVSQEVIGSRFFIAPELADGRLEDASEKSDIYSLGKLLYWLIAGRIFDREKHRDPRWDLSTCHALSDVELGSPLLVHLSELLDKMLQADPKRRPTLQSFSTLSRAAHIRVKHRFGAIGKSTLNLCRYCGTGLYRSPTDDESRALGPIYNGMKHSRLVCTQCGHVELFLTANTYEGHKWDL